jgi:serine/threonine protein kinase
MSYLHEHNIIHRDIKPENIGFDIRDDVKIFDFGFAKELHVEDRLSDGTFHLTGMTGSLRYMVC